MVVVVTPVVVLVTGFADVVVEIVVGAGVVVVNG